MTDPEISPVANLPAQNDADYLSPYLAIPPFQAWREPERWLAYHDGRIKRSVEKITIPTDADGLVLFDEYISLLNEEVFRRDFVWAYNSEASITRPVLHSIYGPHDRYEPENNGGDFTPLVFSELKSNVVILPWIFRGAMLAISKTVEKPLTSVMKNVIRQSEGSEIPLQGQELLILERHFPEYHQQLMAHQALVSTNLLQAA